MRTKSSSTENGIDTRTRRACTGCMIVVPEGGASGLFAVYSATDGNNEIYTVDLREDRCEYGDHEHREPAGGCKHIRRVKLALGIVDIPEALHGEIDPVLAKSCEKFGVTSDGEADLGTKPLIRRARTRLRHRLKVRSQPTAASSSNLTSVRSVA